MILSNQKFWPEARVPADSTYIGSFTLDGMRCDLHATTDDAGLLFAQAINPSIIRPDGAYHFAENRAAAEILRAHLAKQSAQPAPAMSREQMREVGEQAYKQLLESGEDVTDGQIIECIIDALHPELKPKPAPVEPVKTAGEAMVEWYYDGEPLSDRLELVKKIDFVLAARDAAHQTAMVEQAHTHLMALADFQNRCAEMMENDYHYRGLAIAIRNLPLTAPKAEAQP